MDDADVKICSGCGKHAPGRETVSDSSLISVRYGWRLTRKKNPDGTSEPEWHCPKCWAALKAAAAKPDSTR